MKKIYNAPEAALCVLEDLDVLTLSNGGEGNYDDVIIEY